MRVETPARQPLLAVPLWRVDLAPHERRIRLLALVLLMIAIAVVYAPTLHNQFMRAGFDDGIILVTTSIRDLTWQNLRAMATTVEHAHYIPLTLLSFAIDYRIWALDPFGYHLTNVALHLTAAVLVWVFLSFLFRTNRALVVGTAIFALHPVQLEVVAIAVQRKTLLAACLFFASLLLYLRWQRGGRAAVYGLSLLLFAAAALAKQSVVTLPLVLMLCDYALLDGQLHLTNKLPYFAIAAAVTFGTVLAHTEVNAIYPPHGGSIATHILLMARVFCEYFISFVAPVDLAPTYYYPRSILFTPTSFAAVALVASLPVYLAVFRQRYRWSFWCLLWFALTILPEANVLPISQPRADHFLYLATPAFAMWVASAVERWPSLRLPSGYRLPTVGVALMYIALLAAITRSSTSVWHDQVAAWSRVVERHPWAAAAHYNLGIAYYFTQEPVQAEQQWKEALQLKPEDAGPHLYMARMYDEYGAPEQALEQLHQYLERRPNDPDGLELLKQLSEKKSSE